MAIDKKALALSKKYTKETWEGGGAVAGKPCTIDSIESITGGHRVTFKWTLESGTEKTQTMDVMDGVDGQDGADGQDGKGIKRVYINNEEHLMIVYTDDTETDAGAIEVQSAVDSVNGKTGEVVLDASDVGALPDDTALFSGDYNDLTNKPDLFSGDYDDLTNKPTLGTAAALNVAASGDAGSSEVVKGDDTRLTDSRTPTAHTHTLSEVTDAGTAAWKDYTDLVRPNSHDLVESGSVYSAITEAVSSVYTPRGSKTCAELTSALLIDANIGSCYNVTDSGTTTADYIQGAGQTITAGDTVGIVKAGATAIKFNLMGNTLDLHNYQTKALESAIAGQSTVETALSALNTNKAEKSEMSITDGTGADAGTSTITLKTGTSKKVLTAHQDISGKANKSEMSVTDGTGADADKTTIQLKDGTSATVLKSHQDISGKADKTELADYTTRTELKDTVGWGGKNVYPLKISDVKMLNTTNTVWTGNVAVKNGVTYTVETNTDGYVTSIDVDTDGQATTQTEEFILTKTKNVGKIIPDGNYIYNGCPVGGEQTYSLYFFYYDTESHNIYDRGSGAEITIDNTNYDRYNFSIQIAEGKTLSHKVFYPMVRRADVADGTFEVYHESVKQTLRDAELIEGKNLLPNTYKSYSEDHVSFNVNSDGEITVNADGQKSSVTYLSLDPDFDTSKYAGCVFTGFPGTGSTYTYEIRICANTEDRGTALQVLRNNGDVIVDNGAHRDIALRISGDYEVSNLKIQPMLRKDGNDVFVPYYTPLKDAICDYELVESNNLFDNTAITTVRTGVTYTVNDDKTVTVNGATTSSTYSYLYLGKITITEPCYVTGAAEGSTNIGYRLRVGQNDDVADGNGTFVGADYGSGYKISTPGTYKLSIYVGDQTTACTVTNKVFRPMVSKVKGKYRPYFKAMKDSMLPRSENNRLGAKNIFNHILVNDEKNGVTITVNADKSITVNGTNSVSNFFNFEAGLFKDIFADFIGIPCILSLKASSDDLAVIMQVHGYDGNNNTNLAIETNTETKFLVQESALSLGNAGFYLQIRPNTQGHQFDDVTLYPMIRLASDPDNTYQPPAMTNKRLTDNVFFKRVLSSVDDLNDIKTTGIYGTTTSPTNAPESQTYGTLIVQATSSGDVRQLFWRAGGSGGLLYIRSYGGNPASWTGWFKFTGTAV